MEHRSFQTCGSNPLKEFFIKLYSFIVMFFITLFMANPRQNRNNGNNGGFNRSSSNGGGGGNFRSSSQPPPENSYTRSFRMGGMMGGG
jgi:hypothetical protein